jgi:hypothetical protein
LVKGGWPMTAAAAAASAAASAAAASAAAASSVAATSLHMTSRAAVRPSAMPPAHIFATLKPPPIEKLGVVYFSPLMAPVLVATRIPQPAPNQETISTFLRIESGGGRQRADTILWDMTLILHSYAPNEQESVAEDNLAIAVAWGANAQGQTITTASGEEYFVTYSRATGLSHRQADPNVDLIRYRSMVLWRVPGVPIGPGQ